MPRFGFAVSHGGAGARRRRALLSLGRRGAIPSASHDEGAVLSSSAARCKCMMPPSSHDEGAVPSSGATLSLGRRGTIPPASHDEGTVLSHGWGASVSYGSARVLALHARGAEVAVVMGVAVGAVAGVAGSAGWGLWRGSSCGVESSLASWAES